MTKPIPYPAETAAKGYRFELDLDRVIRSDTWALATPELRPWLLMLWTTAWQQQPCGSMPSDDLIVAARLGMPVKAYSKCKEILMRGWWMADDGRMYHDTLVERVLEMISRKNAERDRKAAWRAAQQAKKSAKPENNDIPSKSVPPVSHGTGMGLTLESHGSDGTGTGTGTGTCTMEVISSCANPSHDGSKVPKDPAAWAQVFYDEFGVEVDHRSVQSRAKFYPIAAAWTKAGITVQQMRDACKRAQTDASETIAYLPSYVDRVLATMQSKKPEATASFSQQDARTARERWEQMTGKVHPDNQPANVMAGITAITTRALGVAQ